MEIIVVLVVMLSFFLSAHEFADADATSSPLELGVVDPAFRFLVLHAPLEGDVLVRDRFDPGVSEPNRLLLFPPVPVFDRPRFYQFVAPSFVHVRVKTQNGALLEILVLSET